MFEIMQNWEILDLWVVENYKMEGTIMRQILNSPSPQRGAPEPISRLTVLCVCLFYPYFFPSQINPIPLPLPPPKKKKNLNNQNASLRSVIK